MALAATGGSLVKRVKRLLDQPEGPRGMLAPALSALVLMVTMVAGLAAWQPPAAKADNQYDHWLKEDVVYIIQDRERAAFKGLGTDQERDHFIEQFWERRNPVPGSAVNDFKEEHYRRIGYANTRFSSPRLDGWKTDRGRIYIIYGPPDEIESHPSPANAAAPYEQWKYRVIQGIGENVIIDFVDEARTGEYRMKMDPNPPR
jgi:GWxTD domain-containing protein